MKFYQTELDNGLTVLGEARESAVSVGIGFFVKTGARDETQDIAGVSHFLEHMMFKGTKTRSALDITYQLGAIGAQANAYTTEENTVYYAAVLPEYFHDAFELLSDMLQPALDPGEFDTEKKVILEEIALYQDRPTHILFETMLREFFQGSPAGNSVLGTTTSIGSLSRDAMLAYFQSRYTASNIVLGVAGNFDWEETVNFAKKYCGHWPRKPVSRLYTKHESKKSSQTITKADLQCGHLCLATRGPAAQDDALYPIQTLSCILGDGSGSRTYWELIDKGLADAASIDGEDMDQTGMIYGYVSSQPSVIDDVGEVLAHIMRTPNNFSKDDLERAKTKLTTRLVLQGESSLRRMMTLGTNWLYQGKYISVEEELKRFKEVTQDSIFEALERFSLEPITAVKLLPA